MSHDPTSNGSEMTAIDMGVEDPLQVSTSLDDASADDPPPAPPTQSRRARDSATASYTVGSDDRTYAKLNNGKGMDTYFPMR